MRPYKVKNIETTMSTPNTAKITPKATLKGLNADPTFSHHRLRFPLSSANQCRLLSLKGFKSLPVLDRHLLSCTLIADFDSSLGFLVVLEGLTCCVEIADLYCGNAFDQGYWAESEAWSRID